MEKQTYLKRCKECGSEEYEVTKIKPMIIVMIMLLLLTANFGLTVGAITGQEFSDYWVIIAVLTNAIMFKLGGYKQ